MGGGFALALAAGHGFSAAAPNYGALPKDAASALDGACPIVASYGKKDRTLRGSAAKLEQILSEKSIPHDVKEYPGAGHSFMDEFSAGDGGKLIRGQVGDAFLLETDAWAARGGHGSRAGRGGPKDHVDGGDLAL